MYFTNFKKQLERILLFILRIMVFLMIIVVNATFSYNIYAQNTKVQDFHNREVFLGGQNICINSQIDYGMIVLSVDESSVDIRPKDIILEIDSEEFCNYNQIGDSLADKDFIVIKIKRGNDIFDLRFEKEDYISFQCRKGLTSATLTFYDKNKNLFASAGHNIALGGDKHLVSNYDIKGVIKSQKESEFVGCIDGSPKSDNIGIINFSDAYGAYGAFNDDYNYKDIGLKNKVVLGGKSDFYTGNAKMYCCIDDEGVKEYDVLVYEPSKEYFKIKIIDQELINKTGGILRGMSGSPIVQNGKIIGALSNTTLGNPICGSAVFIDYMANSLYKN